MTRARFISPSVAASALTASIVLTAAAALAEEPTRGGPSVALEAGYGFQLGALGAGGLSAYGFGFGARGGVTLASHVYVGGVLAAHLGTFETARGDGGAFYEARYHDAYLGPEVSYDFDLGRFLVRPSLGVGALAAFGRTTTGTTSFDDNAVFVYVAPGGLAAYRVGRLLVGLDLRMPITVQSPDLWAPTVMLSVGIDLAR